MYLVSFLRFRGQKSIKMCQYLSNRELCCGLFIFLLKYINLFKAFQLIFFTYQVRVDSY